MKQVTIDLFKFSIKTAGWKETSNNTYENSGKIILILQDVVVLMYNDMKRRITYEKFFTGEDPTIDYFIRT